MEVLSVDCKADNAAEVFAQSLRETGFAVLENHSLNWDNMETIYREWQAFFESEDRFNFLFDKKTQEGYASIELSEKAKGHTVKDIKEFYDFYRPWGRNPAGISKVTEDNFYCLFALAKKVLTWAYDCLPDAQRLMLSEPFVDMLSMERTAYRILYYPPLSGDEDPNAFRSAAHTDSNLITLLPAATQSGLQVLNKQGEWLKVPVNHKSIIVNAGDMLQAMTGGYYQSTVHGVLNPTGEAAKQVRMSTPMFVHPRADVPFSEQYATVADFLKQRLEGTGLM